MPLWDAAQESGRWSRGVAAPAASPLLHLAGCEPEAQPAAVLPAAALTPARSPALPPAQQHWTRLSDLSKPRDCLAVHPQSRFGPVAVRWAGGGGRGIHRVNKTWSFLQFVAFPYNHNQFTG